MLSARLRSGPSAKRVVMMDRPAGAVKAAAAPLRKRVTTSSVPSSTTPPTADAAVKTASPSRKRTPQRTAISPMTDASHLTGAGEEVGEVIVRDYMHAHKLHSG